MAKNYGSAVFQVEKVLRAVFTPDASRHAGKLDGTAAAHIYSIGAMKTYLSCDIVFAKWVRKEFNEKFIGGIGPEMVERFIRNLHERDLSHATINKYVAAIAKLDAGLRAVDLDSQRRTITVAFEQGQHLVSFTWRETNNLRLAFAATIHKAQGSGFPVVVIPVLFQQRRMLKRNLLYTAITRAQKLCVLVGTRQAIQFAAENTNQARRWSGLAARLHG